MTTQPTNADAAQSLAPSPTSATAPHILPHNARQLSDTNERELALIDRLLAMGRDHFTLAVARCNTPRLRNDIIARVRERHPGICVIDVPPNTDIVFRTVSALVGDGVKPEALFIVGLENSVAPDDERPLAVRSANAARELWAERFSCPVIFFLPAFMVTHFVRSAPDLWRWVSHNFTFEEDPETKPIGTFAAAEDPRFELVLSMPAEAKQHRIKELTARLNDASLAQDPAFAGRRIDWMLELARLHQFVGSLDEAESWLKQAIALAKDLDAKPELAVAYNNMSQIEKARGRLDEAESWLKKAIDIDEELGNKPNLAIRYNNMSQIEKARGRLDQAESWLKKAIAIDEDLRDKPNLAISYNNMSQIEKARGRLDEAESWLKKAIAIDEELGNKPNLAIRYSNMSTLNHARGRLDEAEAWLNKSITILEELGETPRLPVAFNNMSQIELARGRFDEAESWVRRAWGCVRDLDASADRKTIATNLIKLLKARKKPDDARTICREADLTPADFGL